MGTARGIGLGLGAIVAAAALLPVTPATPAVAAMEGAATAHYYLEVGATGTAAPSPECTSAYTYANKDLPRRTAVPVCYPASSGPLSNGRGAPDPTAPSYDDSVREGDANLLRTAARLHRAHPSARLTLTGYSQGAQVVGDVLEKIAQGRTSIPRARVDGMVYGDPRQPGTGIESVVPTGVSALGFTSAGPGPTTYPGIAVHRFCIRTDAVCDAASPLAATGYLTQHHHYPEAGGIISRTLAHDGGNGTTWYAPSL